MLEISSYELLIYIQLSQSNTIFCLSNMLYIIRLLFLNFADASYTNTVSHRWDNTFSMITEQRAVIRTRISSVSLSKPPEEIRWVSFLNGDNFRSFAEKALSLEFSFCKRIINLKTHKDMHQIVLLEALLPYTDTKAPQLFMENLMVFPFS